LDYFSKSRRNNIQGYINIIIDIKNNCYKIVDNFIMLVESAL